LMPVAGVDGFNQLGDRLSLIAARFVVRFELKRHLSIYIDTTISKAFEKGLS